MRVASYTFITFALLCSVFLMFFRKEHTFDPTARVYVEKTAKGYQLIKDGKPFYIKGASGSIAHLDILREMGGNTIRLYDTINFQNKLDSAYKYNISVIADIPLLSNDIVNPYASEFKKQRTRTLVKNFVFRYKDHPALLMWVLGNEINYPIWNSGNGFTQFYNDLVRMVKEIDPDHPVTLAIPQVGRHLILKLWYTTDLDLISINSFGGIKNLKKDINQIQFLWNGPFLISEWNDEGPWNDILTKWGAPIEPTSAKKAERLKSVHHDYIAPLDDRNLGSLIFYWGNKHERTHTWFSLFDEDGQKTPSLFALQSIFKNEEKDTYKGPEMKYIMLNKYGPQESMLLTQGRINTADVFFNAENCDSIRIEWEILPEVWNTNKYSNRKESKPSSLNHLILYQNDNLVNFRTPGQEGPYRIFCTIKDQQGNVARANFPFYVINQANAQN